ncbi:hypothetical protein CSV61_15340 [Sporosarcina sp. P3]|uniref:TRAP transporter substrate-binding protein DctP n=1 Tax=Sporosarcina sp. P3 TaxID=2048245 RepID=UPI000C16B048|nr:TRAP transporter substrate-binding protein DctP [Sporosarcina sp. P3]PID20362.1 hypothetical protein CSV61_15340 [Sporosarcina sp. P3]
MNKKKWVFALFAALFLLSACSEDSQQERETESNKNMSSGETKKLRASSGVPDGHFWHRGFFEPLTTAVSEGSDGEVEFELFTSGELVGLGGELDALNSGSIDVALTLMPPYDPKRFPYTEVVMLPLLDSDSIIASQAMANMMKNDREIMNGKTYYELEFEDKGLVAFANTATEPYLLSTTKQKFDSVKDFKSALRVRTASRVHEILAKDLGITGQSMPITDSYDALSRNALDGIMYNAPDWIVFGFDELIKHTITGANLGHFVGHTAMKKETWDSLTDETQKLFEDKANEFIHSGAALTASETEENVKSNIKKGGELTHFDELNPEVQDHLKKSIVNSWMSWIDNLEEQNLAGKEMAILWRDMLLEAGAVLPQEILDIK